MRISRFLALCQTITLAVLGFFLFSSHKPDVLEKERSSVSTRMMSTSPLLRVTKISDVIHYGESLWDILHKYHLERGEILALIREFKKLYDPRAIQAGDSYQIVCNSLHQLVTYRYEPDITTVYTIQRDSSGEFVGSVKKVSLIREIKTLSGTITSTLYESMIEKGATPELILTFSDIFQWDVDFFVEPQPGDSYKLVYEAFYSRDRFVRYGHILAAQYSLQGEVMTAFFYDPPSGKSGYYDWEGRSFQKTFLKSPLNYRRISSYFSLRRRHPILKRVRPHYGVDFVANEGTPVVAPADGVVIETGYQARGLGRYLRIRHKNAHFVTLYGHLKAYARGIRKGVAVKQRQTIGYVGKTGLATGPHLHYTFYENGRPINPLRIRNVSADPLKPGQITAFQRTILPWLEKLAAIDDNEFAWNKLY